mmetsp:Transcript_77073/g.160418  ORF Transcript_77073/g.160418 Transcript_77073/m.160418 type:complete len:226 (+) Transcript_77073:583-1260(+)
MAYLAAYVLPPGQPHAEPERLLLRERRPLAQRHHGGLQEGDLLRPGRARCRRAADSCPFGDQGPLRGVQPRLRARRSPREEGVGASHCDRQCPCSDHPAVVPEQHDGRPQGLHVKLHRGRHRRARLLQAAAPELHGAREVDGHFGEDEAVRQRHPLHGHGVAHAVLRAQAKVVGEEPSKLPRPRLGVLHGLDVGDRRWRCRPQGVGRAHGRRGGRRGYGRTPPQR